MELDIRDIQEVVLIPDHSFAYLLTISIALFLALLALGYYLFRRFKAHPDLYKQEALKRARKIDYSDAKEAAYNFTLLSSYLSSPEREEERKEILHLLEPFKYKKDVKDLPKDLAERMRRFCNG